MARLLFPWRWRRLAAIAVVVGGGVLVLTIRSGDPWAAGGAGVLAWALVVVSMILTPHLRRRRFGRAPLPKQRIQLELDEHGVTFLEPGDLGRIEGRRVRGCTITSDLVVLRYDPGRSIAIPRRALDDDRRALIEAQVRTWAEAEHAHGVDEASRTPGRPGRWRPFAG